MRFDVLVKNGHVVDPAAGYDGRLEVGIRRGRIVEVGESLSIVEAAEVIDARGQYVVPGLIDLHTHVFRGVGYFGIDADSIAWQTGVTTWVDAGSSGAFTLPGFREFIIDRSQVRILAFIAISYLGMPGLNYDEYANIETCNLELLGRAVAANRDIIVGIKVRMGTGRAGNHGLEPLRRARTAADELGIPIMSHIATSPPPVDEILSLLGPGDIVTHAYTGQSERLIDDDGRLLDAAQQARERGVIFDIGHGSGSFSWATAESLVEAGFPPDVISTDLHWVSLAGPNLIAPTNQEIVARVRGDGTPQFTLPVAMSKFLHLGMSLNDVIEATTSRPASIVSMDGEIGTLRPGARADFATFMIDEGTYELYDIHGSRRTATRMLRNTGTWKDGRPMPPKLNAPHPPWIRLVDLEG
jgi:dihydroorotase